MANLERYPEIHPKEKTIKLMVTRVNLFFLGMGFQTAYKVDPIVKNEIDQWPDTFTFVFSVLGGPRMVIQKRSGRVQYLGEKETFFSDLELCFKNIEYAFLAVTGQMTPQEATCQNRQFVKGDLNLMMSVVRVLNRIQWLLLPSGKNPNKDEPKLQSARIRALLYLNAAVGMIK